MHQILLLEKELSKLDNEITNAQLCTAVTEHLDSLLKKQATLKKELAKLRIQEFEEREYLDFDDDYR